MDITNKHVVIPKRNITYHCFGDGKWAAFAANYWAEHMERINTNGSDFYWCSSEEKVRESMTTFEVKLWDI